MKQIRAIKTKLYPTEEQKQKIDITIDCCRYVYNHMLSRNQKVYQRRGEHLSYYDMQNLMPVMKQYNTWLKEADSQASNYACRQLHTAYQNFFGHKAKFPKFKKKHNSIQGYVTTQIDTDIDTKPVDASSAVGLDFKTTGLYMDSNGCCADMSHYYHKSQKKLMKAQRQVSRKYTKTNKSNNYKKSLSKLQKLHRHIANQRKDFLHKQSTAIAKQYNVVCVEDLNLKAMSSHDSQYSKFILDNSYGIFQDMLQYKLQERGKHFVKVDKWFPSSQICHCCGYQNPELKDLRIRAWICPECKTKHDRDITAAMNIKKEGLRILLNVT